jgi:hypothetical protein
MALAPGAAASRPSPFEARTATEQADSASFLAAVLAPQGDGDRACSGRFMRATSRGPRSSLPRQRPLMDRRDDEAAADRDSPFPEVFDMHALRTGFRVIGRPRRSPDSNPCGGHDETYSNDE